MRFYDKIKKYHNSNEIISTCNDSIWKIYRIFVWIFFVKFIFLDFHAPHIGFQKYSKFIFIFDLLYTAIAHEVLPVSLVDSVTAKVDDETKRPCIQCIHVVYIMLYSFLIHILYAFYMLFINFLYTFYIHIIPI